MYEYLSAVGQDSHRFEEASGNDEYSKPLVFGGVIIPDIEGFEANSDGDVLLHALTNAVSGITGVNILGEIADELCLSHSITDSREYLKTALEALGEDKIIHVSFSVECKRPVLAPYMADIRKSVADMLGIPQTSIGITATSGEGLTDFGRGLGAQVLCSITVRRLLKET